MDEEQSEVERRIEQLARKRDYAADVLGKPILALTYQQEIDKLVREREENQYA